MRVHELSGYVVVRRTRDNATICAAVVLDDKRLANIEFTADHHRQSNRTRQAAMTALKKRGYR